MPDEPDSTPAEDAAIAKLEARVAKLETVLSNLQGSENIQVVEGIIVFTGRDSRSAP